MNPTTVNASTIAKGLLAAALTLAAPAVAVAMPHAVAAASPASPRNSVIRDAAMTRGTGPVRGVKNRRFNLFDHHDRRHFHKFRKRHCTMVETPNGRVRRCRV